MKLKTGILIVVALVAASGAFIYWQELGARTPLTAEGKQELTLAHPTFDANVAAVAANLTNETGMSIWLNATAYAPLPLPIAISFLKNVEISTNQYVIGEISLQALGFGPVDWPHCFVHTNGWIVVYYLKGEPVGKAFPMYKDAYWNWYDKASYKLNDNLLHKALSLITSQIGGDINTAQYYHSQYPAATKLEMAIKTSEGPGPGSLTVTYNVKVPSTFNIDEQSYSGYGTSSSSINVDTTTIVTSGSGRFYGDFSPLLNDSIWHVVGTTHGGSYDYGDIYTTSCILLLYHE